MSIFFLTAVKSILLLFSLAITFVYIISWVKFQKYQFLERDMNIVKKNPHYSRRWHIYKALNQLIFFYVMFIIFGWQIALIDAIIYWITFDGMMNKTILNRGFFYVGTTSYIDRGVQFIAKQLETSPNLVSATLKTIILLIPLALLF